MNLDENRKIESVSDDSQSELNLDAKNKQFDNLLLSPKHQQSV